MRQGAREDPKTEAIRGMTWDRVRRARNIRFDVEHGVAFSDGVLRDYLVQQCLAVEALGAEVECLLPAQC